MEEKIFLQLKDDWSINADKENLNWQIKLADETQVRIPMGGVN